MRSLLLLLSFWPLILLQAQSYKHEIELLCSDDFDGRGYVNQGDKKTALYIASQFEKARLKKFGKNYFQPFQFQVNTFPSAMLFVANQDTLEPGNDYLVNPYSKGAKGHFVLWPLDGNTLRNDSAFLAWLKKGAGPNATSQNTLLLLDTMTLDEEPHQKRFKQLQYNALKLAGVVIKSKRNLLWSVGVEQAAYITLELRPEALPQTSQNVYLNIEAKLIRKHRSQNVVGYVKGTVFPDSFLVLTAHYDHLGRMGNNTYFPGANDNASGTVMMLELMRHFSQNPQPYSIAFIAFAAEEAGLIGSKYFVDNPIFPLASIKFLLNIDLAGTGADGITVVNATLFEREFQLLKEINEQKQYLKQVLPRGKAANSDHYWFSENGVRAVFIYQMGEYGHYHDPGDQAQRLPLTHFEANLQLYKDFFVQLQKPAH